MAGQTGRLNGDWVSYSKLILSSLESLKEVTEKNAAAIVQLKIEVEVLKTRVGIASAIIATVISSIVGALVSLVLK